MLQLGAATAGAILLDRSRAVGAVASVAGADGGSRSPRPARVGADVALAWFDLAGDLVRTTPGFSPPVAARMFGYAGFTLYESLVPGAGHNIRGDRATRDRYLDVLTDFLTHQPDTTLELQS